MNLKRLRKLCTKLQEGNYPNKMKQFNKVLIDNL